MHKQTAMKKIGFLEDEIESVYRLIAAILHLGNVQFSDTFKNGMDTVNVVDRKGILILFESFCLINLSLLNLHVDRTLCFKVILTPTSYVQVFKPSNEPNQTQLLVKINSPPEYIYHF